MGLSGQRVSGRRIKQILCLVACSAAAVPTLAADDLFPRSAGPSTRAEAIEYLVGTAPAADSCLTFALDAAPRPALGLAPAERRARTLLRRVPLASEQTRLTGDGVTVRYTVEEGAFDRIDPADSDGDGLPDVVQAALSAIADGRGLLQGSLELAVPETLELMFANLPHGHVGYAVPPSHRRPHARIVLDSSATPSQVRRAAIHHYTHAVALGFASGMPPGWTEALAVWTGMSLAGAEQPSTRSMLSRRLTRLDRGLLDSDPGSAAGNALWLAFVDEAYGRGAVAATVDELSGDVAVSTALDRAIRRASSDNLTAAFREFHLWALLVGDRADRLHFPFAALLTPPEFASRSDVLPALSVQTDPAVAPLGATQVLLVPDRGSGGLRVRFEGEFSSGWDVDLVLTFDDGTRHRLPVSLDEGHGDTTVPLDGLATAWLLVRNLGGDDDAESRYSYAAHVEAGYPFELSQFDAIPAPTGSGMQLSWETSSEHQLIGFNIVRVREDGGEPVIVNPVWVPALGDASTATAYHFLDRSTEPGVAYSYRIQGITRDGLTSVSDGVTARLPRPDRQR